MSLPHVFGPLTGQVPLSYLDDNFNAVVMLVSTTVAPVGTNNFRLLLSGGSLTLQPINGNNVDINGTIYTYTAMPTLGAAALTPGTLYYIYLTDILSLPTLEASATAYTIDTVGRAYKTGDPTRRLVGMANPIAGPAWTDTVTERRVRSYDHRDRETLSLVNAFAANRSTSSASYGELSNLERIDFLLWAGESILVSVSGTVYNATPATNNYTSVGFDSITAEDIFSESYVPAVGSPQFPVALTFPKSGLAEGYHFATILGGVSGGTGVWQGSATVGQRTGIYGLIR